MFSELTEFPTTTLLMGTKLSRLHHKDADPCAFQARGYRFDDIDQDNPQFMTTYLSTDPLGAYVEVFGRASDLTFDLIRQHRITEFTLGRTIEVADINHTTNLGTHSIDSGISSNPNYDDSQSLARELFSLGYPGIDYPLRYSLELYLPGIVLFSTTEYVDGLFSDKRELKISRELQSEANSLYNIVVSRSR